MPQVSSYRLAEYRHRITEQIERGHIEEAIAHCRHILAHYPRYLSAYKLLAHACLEKGDFSYANHFFQCVLSADLEDTDAWINLALLTEDLGETQQAIWFLERAFELDPGSTRVRDMLRQLYVQRDGAERTRIKLTPTALARMYAKSGFYQRAIRELEKMLHESANVPRLQVATLEVSLAQALWNSRDRVPLADQVCQSLLAKVPYSLQGNLILGDIRASAGRHQESESHLQVARMLDPEGELAHELFGHRSPLPMQEVKIPYLEYKAPQIEEAQAVAIETEDTSWLDRIGISEEPLDLEDEQAAPAWIKNWAENKALMPTTLDQAPLSVDRPGTELESAPSGVESAQDMAQVPDWLLEVQQKSATPDTDQELPDWLQDVSGKVEDEIDLEAAEQLPDWLQELDTREQVETSLETDEQPTLQGDLPEWLLELSQAEDLEAETTLSVAEDKWTDWPQEQRGPYKPGQIEPEKTTRPLRAPTSQEDAVQPEQVQTLPQWFDERRQEAAAAAPTEPVKETAFMPAAEPPTHDEVPDWLRELSDEGETKMPETPTAEKAKRTAPLATAAAAGLVRHTADQEKPPSKVAAEDLPNWLQELEAEISGKTPTPGAQILATEKPAPPPVTPAKTIEVEGPGPTKRPEHETKDELEGIAEAESALEPMPDDELPDWLQELRADAFQRADAALAETWTAAGQEADEFAAVEESPLEPTPEEQLPDWLQFLRPAGEPQPDRAVSLEKEPEPVPPATPAEWQAQRIDEITPAPSDEMEDMEWLRELEETVVAETAQTEPERVVPISPISQALPETEQAVEEPTIARVEPPALATAKTPPEATAVEPLPVEEAPVPQAQDAETRLALARARLSESALDDSAQEYERLVQEPDLAGELVEELEEAVQAHPDHHALQRVLGDAYMRTGKLQKALQAYRQALSKL